MRLGTSCALSYIYHTSHVLVLLDPYEKLLFVRLEVSTQCHQVGKCKKVLEYSRSIIPTARFEFPFIVYEYVQIFYRLATGLGATLQ